MNRRNFLRNLVGGVAATAAVRTFPFRVFSFPAVVAKPTTYSTYILGQGAYHVGVVHPFTLRDWMTDDPEFATMVKDLLVLPNPVSPVARISQYRDIFSYGGTL